MAGEQDTIELTIDGWEALANLLDELARAEGRRSLDYAMQEACNSFAADVLLPEVRQEVPKQSGLLENRLEAFPVPRETPGGCAGVGYPRDNAFAGPTYYAAFHEFGWRSGKRTGYGKAAKRTDTRPQVPADKFLRRTLYRNEARFEAHVAKHLGEWVRRTNRL